MRWLFGKIFGGLRDVVSSLVDSLLGNGSYDSMFKKVTGSGMTGADIEAANLSLENQQILNEQEFQRKVDFYEMYESPQAQVRQMKSAGLNPALMYSGAPSVSASGGIGSAGSAAAHASSSADISSLISSIAGVALQSKQLELQNIWKQREMDIQEDLGNKEIAVKTDWNNMNRPRIVAETSQIIEAVRGSKLDNDLKEKILPVLEERQRADLLYTYSQTARNYKELDNIDSMIEQRRYQNKHFDAMCQQLYSLIRQQDYYTDVYLPGMLANQDTLTEAQRKDLEESANESVKRQGQIQELKRKAAAEAGIAEKDLENWSWLNARERRVSFYGGSGQNYYDEPPQSKSKSSKPAQNYNPWF